MPSEKIEAQEKDVTENIQDIIAKKQFTFLAETAVPSNFRSRPLSFGYDVQVAPDSVISHLPYFGRAYTINPTAEGGIKFTSTDFVYKSKQKRKKGWEVSIQPRDTRDVRQMSLSISPSGYATLQVISNNRQSISFYGFLSKS